MLQYFQEGIAHITDLDGYDHMLYLAALCAPFTLKEWKTAALLATAFTVGHSLALFLASLDIVRFRSDIIEALIPVTIILTCVITLFDRNYRNRVEPKQFVITTAFGLIHGMGFSTYFRMLADESGQFIQSLLLFNLGVEAGQLIIIIILLVVSSLLTQVFRTFDLKKYSSILSILIAAVAAYLLISKIIGD